MNTLKSLAVAAAITATASLAVAQTTQRAGAAPGVNAQQETMSLEVMTKMMKMIDTNKDGMVSKAEHMKYQEAVFDNMKKMPGGMVEMKVYFMPADPNEDPFRPGPRK